MNNSLKATSIALAVLGLLSFTGMLNNVHAQNATGTNTTPAITRHHDRDFGNLGIAGGGLGLRTHLGVPLFTRDHVRGGGGGVAVSNTPAPVVSTPTPTVAPTPTVTRDHDFGRFAITHDRFHDFGRFHDFAFAHHQHFIFLQNRYVLLPETIGCPPGSSLNIATGECVIVNQVIIQQAAPTILSESVATPPSVVQDQSSTVVQQQTNTVAPNISCPAGSTLQSDNTCQVTTTSTSSVPAIITCPVGTSLQNNQCVEVQQQIVVDPLPCPSCPQGATLVNGQCVVSSLPSQVTVGTIPGEIIVLGHHFHHNGLLPFIR